MTCLSPWPGTLVVPLIRTSIRQTSPAAKQHFAMTQLNKTVLMTETVHWMEMPQSPTLKPVYTIKVNLVKIWPSSLWQTLIGNFDSVNTTLTDLVKVWPTLLQIEIIPISSQTLTNFDGISQLESTDKINTGKCKQMHVDSWWEILKN